MEDIILVNVLIPSIGTDVDVELPVSATPVDIINTLLEKEELSIPKEDPNSLSGDSQAIDYKLFKREKNKRIEIDQDKPDLCAGLIIRSGTRNYKSIINFFGTEGQRAPRVN